MKKDYPGPIITHVMDLPPAFVAPDGSLWQEANQCYISKFLGPRYRLRTHDRRFLPWHASDSPFLLRSVYGDTFGEKEKDLNERYNDWKRFSKVSQNHDEVVEYFLPCPFNRGEEVWYEEAFEILRKSVASFESGNIGTYPYSPHRMRYRTTWAYQKWMRYYEKFWAAFSEWSEMVGL